jgi:hypothetical protein
MQDGDKHMTVPCPACGANERKDIDWLANNDVLVCSGCGNGINLLQEPVRGEIHRVWNASHNLGPPRRHLP